MYSQPDPLHLQIQSSDYMCKTAMLNRQAAPNWLPMITTLQLWTDVQAPSCGLMPQSAMLSIRCRDVGVFSEVFLLLVVCQA